MAPPARRQSPPPHSGTNAFRSVTSRSKGSFLDFKNSNPSPGSYEESRLLAQQQVRRGESAPFACTSSRFGSDSTLPPGPGNYKADHLMSMTNTVNQKLVSRTGVFGSGQSRFDFGRRSGDSAAPASDAMRPVPVFGADSTKKAPASGFVSGVDRFRSTVSAPVAKPEVLASGTGKILGIKGDPESLGPGKYEARSEFVKPVKRGRSSAAFGGQSARNGALGVVV